MRPVAPLVLAALAAVAGPAAAGPSLTLNGVNIDGVTSQRFESCTVVIDERGDVHIQAKGYAVRSGDDARPDGAAVQGAAAPAPAPGAVTQVTRRYFLAAEQKPPGAQFDLNVFINAQWIREVRANETQAVVEITKYLRAGPNRITLAATKRIAEERLASTKDAALRVVIGEGNVGGDHVMIDLPLVQTERTAAEIEDKTEEFVIDAR